MSKARLNILLVFIFLLNGFLIFQLYKIQIIDAEKWTSKAERQQTINRETVGVRGSVFVTNNEKELIPLAINRTWRQVYISPREVKNSDIDLDFLTVSLSDILGIDEDVIKARLERDSSYELIKRQISSEEISQITELDLPGVYLLNEDLRFYPQNRLASHVVGFVGGMGVGQYGIEGFYDDILKGIPGTQQGWVISRKGQVIFEDSAKMGANIELTIDYNIQFMAEKLLHEAAERLDFTSGTIIVLEPNTGEILTLANYPTFDPNNYRGESLATFKNSAVQTAFEPGSVFKPLIMAVGLEEGFITPQTKYYDKGYEVVSGHTLRNYNQRSYGEVDMRRILELSINTGMVYVQQQIPNNIFIKYLEDFGFFEKTGIELQGEVASLNLPFREGYAVNFANASFGQGIEVTPIQLISAFATLANGGELIRPHITKTFNYEPDRIKRVLSSGTTSQVTSMLISTVEEGTARRAQIPGYYIAGKTGTAQIPWQVLGENKRGYSGETIQSFIGYGPLNAEFVILVKMDRPKAPTAEVSVVPVFTELAKYIIDYKQIPPDYIRE